MNDNVVQVDFKRRKRRSVFEWEQAVPEGDTIQIGASNRIYSYGPRVETADKAAEPPTEGQSPQFWGVYEWIDAWKRWRWISDFATAIQASDYIASH